MTATLGIATITVITAVGNPRPTPGSSKKIMLDAQIYVGSSNCESLLGSLSYFNGSDMVFRKDDVALYLLYATIAKMEDGAQIHPLTDSKEKYDFVGDIQWIVPLTPPSAVNCDEKEATFDVKIDQHISTLKNVKSGPSKFVTPFSWSIPDSPWYKTGKPVPYNR
ncbi:hypothetical protein K443DRAFT_7224 [Laccaria amethystina LaAM-08-1]|uniref:Uncharacterized protein n=1 Tax=Laccaria amethystina LaAM-08-1 TaxID=1095629 RepID=A0A0C9XHE7_9AGAR|nr:hypothetical protein K443DRAFT_7224 [Laccaria amethystina LaAM-08-1]